MANGYATFGSFNNPAKLSDATLDVWAAILVRMPTARLLLKGGSLGDGSTRRRFEQRLAERLKLSSLAACWRTEVGQLNTLIHAWPYTNEDERREVLESEKKIGIWPSEVKEWVVGSRSLLLTPALFEADASSAALAAAAGGLELALRSSATTL